MCFGFGKTSTEPVSIIPTPDSSKSKTYPSVSDKNVDDSKWAVPPAPKIKPRSFSKLPSSLTLDSKSMSQETSIPSIPPLPSSRRNISRSCAPSLPTISASSSDPISKSTRITPEVSRNSRESM